MPALPAAVTDPSIFEAILDQLHNTTYQAPHGRAIDKAVFFKLIWREEHSQIGSLLECCEQNGSLTKVGHHNTSSTSEERRDMNHTRTHLNIYIESSRKEGYYAQRKFPCEYA